MPTVCRATSTAWRGQGSLRAAGITVSLITGVDRPPAGTYQLVDSILSFADDARGGNVIPWRGKMPCGRK